MGIGNQTSGNQELGYTLHLRQFKDAALPGKSRGGGCCSSPSDIVLAPLPQEHRGEWRMSEQA